MTPVTRTAIVITAAYIVLACWMLDFLAGGFDWNDTVHQSVFFLP